MTKKKISIVLFISIFTLTFLYVKLGLSQIGKSRESFSSEQHSFQVRIGGYKSGDSLTIAEFNGLDSIIPVDKNFKVVSYQCMYLPLKGQSIMLSSTPNASVSKLLKDIINHKAKLGHRAYFDNIIIRNSAKERKSARPVILIIR